MTLAAELTELPTLDTNQQLVNPDGTPSAYFEDLWYQASKSIEAINIVLEDHEARLVALEP